MTPLMNELRQALEHNGFLAFTEHQTLPRDFTPSSPQPPSFTGTYTLLCGWPGSAFLAAVKVYDYGDLTVCDIHCLWQSLENPITRGQHVPPDQLRCLHMSQLGMSGAPGTERTGGLIVSNVGFENPESSLVANVVLCLRDLLKLLQPCPDRFYDFVGHDPLTIPLWVLSDVATGMWRDTQNPHWWGRFAPGLDSFFWPKSVLNLSGPGPSPTIRKVPEHVAYETKPALAAA